MSWYGVWEILPVRSTQLLNVVMKLIELRDHRFYLMARHKMTIKYHFSLHRKSEWRKCNFLDRLHIVRYVSRHCRGASFRPVNQSIVLCKYLPPGSPPYPDTTHKVGNCSLNLIKKWKLWAGTGVWERVPVRSFLASCKSINDLLNVSTYTPPGSPYPDTTNKVGNCCLNLKKLKYWAGTGVWENLPIRSIQLSNVVMKLIKLRLRSSVLRNNEA